MTKVSSGQTVSNQTVDNYQQIIEDGGTALYESIINTGEVVVEGGGRLIQTNGKDDWGTYDGGKLVVEDRGVLSGGLFGDNGRLFAAPGALLSGTITFKKNASGSGGTVVAGSVLNIDNGDVKDVIISGRMDVYNSGYADSAIIANAVLNVSSGGRALNITMKDRASAYVGSGGNISGVTLTSGGYFLAVQAGGLVSSANVESGGYIALAGDDTASARLVGAIFSSGSHIDVGHNDLAHIDGSAVATGLNILDGAFSYVYRSGVTEGTVVSSGGVEKVLRDGITSGSDIQAGGSGMVDLYGSSVDATIAGKEDVGYGSGDPGLAQSISATIDSGGLLNVGRGGIARDTVVNSGGHLHVLNDYNTESYGVHVLSGGLMDVENYAWSTNTRIDEGGQGLIHDGGTEVVSNGVGSGITAVGGRVFVEASGSAYDEILSSGYEGVAGGTTYNTVIDGGAHIDLGTNAYTGARDPGVAINMVLSGGDAYIYSGGESVSGVILDKATEWVGRTDANPASGSSVDDTVSSGGTMRVENYGSATGTLIANGGYVRVGLYGKQNDQVQGLMTSVTVESGGSLVVYNRGVVVSALAESGAYVEIGKDNGGDRSSANLSVLSAATIQSGASAIIEDASYVSGSLISGGTLKFALSGSYGSANRILDGGTEYFVNGDAYSTDDDIENGGTVVFSEAKDVVSAHLFYSGSLVFDNFSKTTITSAWINSSDLLTVKTADGQTETIQLASADPNSNGPDEGARTNRDAALWDSMLESSNSSDANQFEMDGDKITYVCFLDGTMIRTPDGDVAVETLRIGDTIETHDPQTGACVRRCLSWVGRQPSRFSPGLPDDEAGYPVRISKDAIADGVPSKDLLVTPEHCLFIDGGFIPARMLVNGASITYDHTLTHFTVHHIETEAHSILWSDNMLSESYLDTGNRSRFTQPGVLAVIGTSHKTWEQDAAAPLTVDRDVVEPIYRRFFERAVSLGFVPSNDVTTTEDADLHLVTTEGVIVRPYRYRNDRALFRLPDGTEEINLRSRVSRPCDTIGPFFDDRRDLGVLVGEIRLFAADTTRDVTSHLHDASLPGWQQIESGGHRWTKGDARLDLGNIDGPAILVIQIVAGGPYRMDSIPLRKIGP